VIPVFVGRKIKGLYGADWKGKVVHLWEAQCQQLEIVK